MLEEWSWDKNDKEKRLELASYVVFCKYSNAVNEFIKKANKDSLPASSNDYHISKEKRCELLEKIYNSLRQQNVEYELNKVLSLASDQQIIRKPEEILGQGKGTCLDLAIIFCAICWYYDFLPILILLDGHALVAVSLTYRGREWENDERQGKEKFIEGSLTDGQQLWHMVRREEVLAIECTGFAKSETLEDENYPREDGFLSFAQAIKLGKSQLENKKLIFALDIHIAYYYWWAKLCCRRLEAEVPKTLTNNEKNLLKHIYVPLGLVERKFNAKRRPDEALVNPKNSEYNQPDKQYEIVKEFKNEDFLNQVLKQGASNTKSQGKRLVIVGDPGGGKSTLLQKIADWVITEKQGLPIWISLGDFKEKELNERGWLYRYLSEIWLKNVSTEPDKTPEIFKDVFKEIIESGQLWLILDGADEMVVSDPLKRIRGQLSEGWAEPVRVVLSCRLNLWEEQKENLGQNFDIYRTLDFNYPDQVHQFINNWFDQDKPNAKKLQDKLAEEDQERLQASIRNPLRLALLCRIWNDGISELPDTKAAFYQLLVDYHNKWREGTIPSKKQNELNLALGKLAREAIDNVNFRFRLQESFIEKNLGDPAQEDSLFWWALKLGWLLHIGYPTEREDNRQEKVYAFFHPTFQEYFAATVDKNYYYFLPKEHINRPVKDGRYRIFEQQWREVILLWLGRKDIEKKQKQYFIKALVDFKDNCGRFYYYQAYFLAAAGIAEFKDCSISDEIVKQIAKWLCWDNDGRWFHKLKRFLFNECSIEVIQKEANAVLRQTDKKKAIAALVPVIDNSQDEDTRLRATDALGEIGVGNQEAIAALVKLIDNSQDEFTRWIAAYALGEIDPGNQEAIATLVKLIDNSQDESTCMRAADALGEIDPGNQEAIATLVKLIDNSQDESTRWSAASALGKIDPGNQEAITALVKLIDNSQDESTRRSATEALGKIDPGNQEALAALVKLIDNSQNESTRRNAAGALGKIGVGNQEALAALVKLIDNSQDESTRRSAAYALGEILTVAQMPEVVTQLKKSSKQVLWNCAQSLTYYKFYQAWHR